MNSDTFLELDLLKDSMGRSLIQPDPTSETGYVLLGLPVESNTIEKIKKYDNDIITKISKNLI